MSICKVDFKHHDLMCGPVPHLFEPVTEMILAGYTPGRPHGIPYLNNNIEVCKFCNLRIEHSHYDCMGSRNP